MPKAAAKPRRRRHPAEDDPEVQRLVRETIERVADSWTMLVLDALDEHGVVRFTQLGKLVGGISQKMLTKTVRQMECDGLVLRTVHPEIPPRVDYRLTPLGRSLGAALCGVWRWVVRHQAQIEAARRAFAEREGR